MLPETITKRIAGKARSYGVGGTPVANLSGNQDSRLIQVAFISVYLSKACKDLSRPLPDCL